MGVSAGFTPFVPNTAVVARPRQPQRLRQRAISANDDRRCRSTSVADRRPRHVRAHTLLPPEVQLLRLRDRSRRRGEGGGGDAGGSGSGGGGGGGGFVDVNRRYREAVLDKIEALGGWRILNL